MLHTKLFLIYNNGFFLWSKILSTFSSSGDKYRLLGNLLRSWRRGGPAGIWRITTNRNEDIQIYSHNGRFGIAMLISIYDLLILTVRCLNASSSVSVTVLTFLTSCLIFIIKAKDSLLVPRAGQETENFTSDKWRHHSTLKDGDTGISKAGLHEVDIIFVIWIVSGWHSYTFTLEFMYWMQQESLGSRCSLPRSGSFSLVTANGWEISQSMYRMLIWKIVWF